MGLFSSAWDWVETNVNSAVDDIKGAGSAIINQVVGGGSSPASAPPANVTQSNHEKAKSIVSTAYMKTLSGGFFSKISQAQAYLKTSAGASAVAQVEGQLNSGAHPDGNTITGFLNQLLGSVVAGASAGVQTGVQNAVTGAINTGAESLGVSSGAQSLQDSLGQFFSGVGSSALKDWFKRNWYYVLAIPVIGVTGVVLWRAYKAKKGGKNARKTVKKSVPKIRKK